MKTGRLWIYGLIARWLPESRGFGFKARLLRWAGAIVGQNVRVYSSVRILGNGELVIGDDVHIGPEVLIMVAANSKVEIGSHVDVGPRVTIVTGSHKIDPAGDHIAGDGTSSSVAISNGCWLGAGSVMLPGIVLPRKSLVAAGAVVTKNPVSELINRNGGILLAGVPAVCKKVFVSALD